MLIKKTFYLLSVAFFFLSSISFSQDLSCKDFHEGTFYGYSEDVEGLKLKWIILRSGNHQTEKTIDAPEIDGVDMNTSLHEIIEWLDDCTYNLKYSPSFGLSIYQKFVNDCGGAINKIINIEGNCYSYTSTITYDGEEETLEGKICKE